MKAVTVQGVETRIFRRGESLSHFILEAIPAELVQEGMLLAVTSKIMSLAEGRLVSRDLAQKPELVEREADVFLGEVGYGCFLTIKEGLFIPSAGIDESNSEGGEFILYPKDPYGSTQRLCNELKAHWGMKDLGILLTDSHTSPLRKGVTGICLAHWGFSGVKNMIGSRDLFGRELQMTKINLADAWSAAAVVVMGEGGECRPLAVLHGVEAEFNLETDREELRMPARDDLYFPFFEKALSRPT